MAVDKNLFMYDLAVVAIMKNEAPYIKEWLDYHLLAGVDHFFIYDNESSDNQKEILQPYIDAGIVTYIFYPGKARQYEAYNDAVQNFKFFCRYMAFIDADEFIFPKTNQSISEVVDEILSEKPDAVALVAHMIIFGSNFHEKADYNRGVLERFTRRTPNDFAPVDENNIPGGNVYLKTILNPRCVNFFDDPHHAKFFVDCHAVDEGGNVSNLSIKLPILADKIVVNHYHTKSYEEYREKVRRGNADFVENHYSMKNFAKNDHNEIFDDGILKYRESRKKIPAEKFNDMQTRILNALEKNLLSVSPKNLPENFFDDKVETFLICLAVSEKFKFKSEGRFISEYALFWLYQTICRDNSPRDLFMIFKSLPEILRLPYPITEKIRRSCMEIIPKFKEFLRLNAIYFEKTWQKIVELDYLLEMLKTFEFYAKK